MALRAVENLLKATLGPRAVHRLNILRRWFVGENELRILPSLVDPSRNAIYVGANRGLYSQALAKVARRAYAYEPNPEVAEYLRKVVPANVTVRERGLSNTSGERRSVHPTKTGPRVTQPGTHRRFGR